MVFSSDKKVNLKAPSLFSKEAENYILKNERIKIEIRDGKVNSCRKLNEELDAKTKMVMNRRCAYKIVKHQTLE